MTDVEYTEQALDHLDGLETEVADRVLNKVDAVPIQTDAERDRPVTERSRW